MESAKSAAGDPVSPARILARLGVDASRPERLAATLPFLPGDATLGTENELQAAVGGAADQVDLPMFIEGSNFYQNIVKRQARGDLPRRAVSGLESWLGGNPDQVWENSWVRLPFRALSPAARRALERDWRLDKSRPELGRRSDWRQFKCQHRGESCVRLPVSYLLKLALIDAVDDQPDCPEIIRRAGERLSGHFLNDNTSPETYSFHVSGFTAGGGRGRAVAREASLRFLLTQLLCQYAGRKLGLLEWGQKVDVYFAPHPPVRQRELNEHVSDSFYRDLFMSPCLSGWDRGQDKHRYMHLCHQVLSRAHLNAVSRLKEAGIIMNNLIVLPRASNISLANNGTHLSLGSRLVGNALAAGTGDFNPAGEKCLGDLAIKLVEHFLPLFVGAYSAAPYRLSFADFHPEKALGFLPLELDYTHLRMIWRRWRKKARIKLKPLGLRTTPFGPEWLDALLARAFRLRGDFVGDYRLVDYLAAVMSTESSPALDGRPGNQHRLKDDLAALGVFDPKMSLYLLYRQREFATMGFSGFEGRHYSLFYSIVEDLGRAAEMQTLITALAFKLMATGRLSHAMIPDRPELESERRQVFFGAAIGIPTFYVRMDTPNLFLKELVQSCRRVRPSRRYPGFWRVHNLEYRRALVRYLEREAADLVEAMGLDSALEDLRWRVGYPEKCSALGRLTRGVMGGTRESDPCRVPAGEFNREAERYYRQDLKRSHLAESLDELAAVFGEPAWRMASQAPALGRALQHTLDGLDPSSYLDRVRSEVLAETASAAQVGRMINLVLLALWPQVAGGRLENEVNHESPAAPIYRANLG